MIAEPSSTPATDFTLRLVASFLILWMPFHVLARSFDYPIPAIAMFYSALLLAVAAFFVAASMGPRAGLRRVVVSALFVCIVCSSVFRSFDGAIAYLGAAIFLIAFWRMRARLTMLLAVSFAVMVAVVAIVPPAPYVDQGHFDQDGIETRNESATRPKASGRIVHLVLDEFAGIDGIPDDIAGSQEIKSDITDFFESHGFMIHPNAISQYATTRASLSSMLNFEATATPDGNYHGKRPYILSRNAYFEELDLRGYEINVYESTYMDYCQESPVPIASCFYYRYDGVNWLRNPDIDDFQKSSILLGLYLNEQGLPEAIWKAYVKTRRRLRKVGITLPAIMTWDGTVASIATMSAIEPIREAILAAPEGSAHFGHLMLSHGPYVFDRTCKMQDGMLDWLNHRPLHGKFNTAQGREQRFEVYFDHLRCSLAQLGELFEKMEAAGRWADTTVIVHGDHGSRFFVNALRASNLRNVTAQDLKDGYVTLYAVKTDIPQTFDVDRPTPVSELVAQAIGMDAETGEATLNPTVYLEGDNDEPWASTQWMNVP